jgi:hypothetical protein
LKVSLPDALNVRHQEGITPGASAA